MPYKNRNIRLAYHKEYNSAYYDIYKDEKNSKARQRIKKYRAILFSILGKECIKCGYSDMRALQFDHKEGNGRHDRKTLGSSLYPYYVKRPELALKTLQVLCANCNYIKRVENDEINSHRRIR